MGKYNIVVYAICKNEAKYVSRWMESMSEADRVVVLDTGSEDETVQLLREAGAQVTVERIVPWRFDAARNRSLELVPEDAELCVCTDLDEWFRPGWRAELERVWSPEYPQVRYPYIWNFREDGTDGVSFWGEKIHSRRGFHWVHPVHEVLKYEGGQPRQVYAPGIRLEHHADPKKSRGQYLPLLELAAEETPEDDRTLHYLGREYMFRGRYEDAIRTLKRHLALPSAKWEEERCASMRYLGRCCAALGQREEAERWWLRACAEAPRRREPWMELGRFYCGQENWAGTVFAARQALSVTERLGSYLSDPVAWGEGPYDLLAVGLYYLGDYEQAERMAAMALSHCPGEERLARNLELIREKTKINENSSQ